MADKVPCDSIKSPGQDQLQGSLLSSNSNPLDRDPFTKDLFKAYCISMPVFSGSTEVLRCMYLPYLTFHLTKCFAFRPADLMGLSVVVESLNQLLHRFQVDRIINSGHALLKTPIADMNEKPLAPYIEMVIHPYGQHDESSVVVTNIPLLDRRLPLAIRDQMVEDMQITRDSISRV